MNHGAEAADQVVNMSLRGIEVMAKISGEGAKNLAVYLHAVLRGQTRTKGRARLESLLRSGKELKVFAVRNEDLPTFCKEAKRYGVLYCALRDKKHEDGLCDIMVRAEDAAKINRIVERFKLATVDTAKIKSEIAKSRNENQEAPLPEESHEHTEEHAATMKGTPAEKSADDFLDELMAGPKQPEPMTPPNDNPNPTTATAEKSLPSELTYARSEASAEGTIEPERKSVRQELQEIREAQREQAGPKHQRDKEPSARRSAHSFKKAKTSKSKPKEIRKRGKAK